MDRTPPHFVSILLVSICLFASIVPMPGSGMFRLLGVCLLMRCGFFVPEFSAIASHVALFRPRVLVGSLLMFMHILCADRVFSDL
jgi:hypothetical protein